jgi:F0F1-type ATP synthase assembly protein I
VRVALGSTKACANVETTMRNFISSIFVAAAVGLVLDAVVLPAGLVLP